MEQILDRSRGAGSADPISLKRIFILSFLFFALTGLINIGFIAVDDYYHGIIEYIPAQRSSFHEIIALSGIRSPVPNMFLLGLSKTALALGFTQPAAQLRFINVVLALIAQIIVVAGALHFKKEDRAAKISAALLAFYFASPLFFTRPLIEAMAAPPLLLSSYFLCRYWNKSENAWLELSLSVLSLAVASILRFQCGICALAFPLVILLKRRARDLGPLLAVGAVAFFAAGSIDLYLKGRFLDSLRGYLDFNLHHSSMFGTTPFYSFALLFVGLSIPPTFFSRFKSFDYKKAYRPLLPCLLYFAFFLISHSMVPHKEERFMVPALPLFLILLVPALLYFAQNQNLHWRWKYFWILNGLLLLLVSFSTVQRNTIGLAQFLNERPEYKGLVGVGETLSVFPKALILRENFTVSSVAPTDVEFQGPQSCDLGLAVRADLVTQSSLAKYEKTEEFSPALPEALVVKLNPKKNGRRGSIFLYKLKGC